MSIEQLESTLMELSREDRRQFARWFYDHEHEIVDSGNGGSRCGIHGSQPIQPSLRDGQPC